MEMADMSGEPRRLEELLEAKRAVEVAIVKSPLAIPPQLYIMLPTIRDVLDELITLRKGGDASDQVTLQTNTTSEEGRRR